MYTQNELVLKLAYIVHILHTLNQSGIKKNCSDNDTDFIHNLRKPNFVDITQT